MARNNVILGIVALVGTLISVPTYSQANSLTLTQSRTAGSFVGNGIARISIKIVNGRLIYAYIINTSGSFSGDQIALQNARNAYYPSTMNYEGVISVVVYQR